MRFEQMILKNGPFDIIMDGLNVAYSTNIKVDKHTGYTRKKPIPSGFMVKFIQFFYIFFHKFK